MSASETIDELLLRWQELRQRDPRPSIPEVCADHPSLADELARRVAAFESMEAMLGLGAHATIPEAGVEHGVHRHLAEKLLALGYQLHEMIDQGGMGVVYKATQVKLQRTVALKMIAGLRVGPKQLARFRVEVEAVARLQHPNIVQIYEVGEVDGHSFFAMEYVAGGTLAERLAAGPLPPESAAALLETLARAIHHAHTRAVVHRDLKPANILLQRSEDRGQRSELTVATGFSDLCPLTSDLLPKVSDFGLAKRLGADTDHTATGEVIGTPNYMAPEQAEGKTGAIGPACDVYALGAILYEALTGRPPFQAKTILETLRRVASEEPRPPRRIQPAIPRDLEAVCLKCLEKHPARRYPTAEALADDLHRFVTGVPVLARPLTFAGRVRKWSRRHPAWTALLLLMVMVPVTIAGWEYAKQEYEHRRKVRRAIEVAPQAREILQRHCIDCHGNDPKKAERGFMVLDRASLLDPKRKYVVPGHPENSRLMHRIVDGSMPPEEEEVEYPRVSQLEQSILREWIVGGAPPFPPEDPQNPTPPVVPYSESAARVRDIFLDRCYECHQYTTAKGDKKSKLRILNHELLTVTRQVVVPGSPDESEVYQLLIADDSNPLRMPEAPNDRLTPEEIEAVRLWIEAGAPPFPRTPGKK